MSLVVMVGLYRGMIKALEQLLPPASLVVLEEPDLIAGKGLRGVEDDYPLIRQVWHTPYQEHDGFEPVVELIGDRHRVDAVIAAFEYAVPAAARAAEQLGLPGLSVKAAETLRHKDRLREACTAAGLPVPRWSPARSPEDVAAFLEHGDTVLKPANRQASLGVLRLDAGSDAHAAWAEAQAATADEGGSQVTERGMPTRFMVEELLHGPEYSTEALVADGRLLFCNVTRKHTVGGRYPVELGHVVPAPPESTPTDDLRAATQALVDATGVRTGILHAEWILAGGVPHVIECAGRVPGDFIVDLIDVTHHTSLTHLMYHLLCGRDVPAPAPHLAAGVRFLTAPPGRVREVTGIDDAAVLPGVTGVEVTASPGDEVKPLRSSWERVGYVMAHATDHDELDRRLDAAEAAVTITVEETEPRSDALA